mmetsp:Transcript_27213/g.49432  ORF Transcript_27213/g.49432 Transcript_27213/m.49432 type:complete len:253 (-) Transcript_27213:215-973(-)
MAAPGGGSAFALPEEAFSNSSFSIPTSRTSFFTMCPKRSIPNRCSFNTWNNSTLSCSRKGSEEREDCCCRDSVVAPLVLHVRACCLPLSSKSARDVPTKPACLAISPRRRRDSTSADVVGWPMHRTISTLRMTSINRLRKASCWALDCFAASLDDRAAFSKNCSDCPNFFAWDARAFAFSCWETMRVCKAGAPTSGTGISSRGSGLRASASFHTGLLMWGGLGADRWPCARCSGGKGSYRTAVKAQSELGAL